MLKADSPESPTAFVLPPGVPALGDEEAEFKYEGVHAPRLKIPHGLCLCHCVHNFTRRLFKGTSFPAFRAASLELFKNSDKKRALFKLIGGKYSVIN